MLQDSEKKLVQNIIQKDDKALHTFYKRYYPQILNFVSSKINDKAKAEEITQDVFLSILESLRDFRYQCSLKTFIFTIARNKTIDYMRKKKVKSILFSAFPQFIVEGFAKVVMDEELEKKELQEKMERVFTSLPKDYELILRLKYMEGESVENIAEKMSRTFKSTESLLFRARKAFIKVYDRLT